MRRIRPDDGWCEDPSDRHYNRRVAVPKGSKADRLTRADALYDFIIELDHSRAPASLRSAQTTLACSRAKISAVARPGFAPTAGCVALAMPALRRLIERAGPGTRIAIGP